MRYLIILFRGVSYTYIDRDNWFQNLRTYRKCGRVGFGKWADNVRPGVTFNFGRMRDRNKVKTFVSSLITFLIFFIFFLVFHQR